MREEIIRLKKFSQVDLTDTFFDSLRESYTGFDKWFRRKADEKAYVVTSKAGVQAFLYLKIENGAITDIDPPLNSVICLKVGTFKINARGTRLGERFVKKIFDHALINDIKHIYVTVFEHHEVLISILKRYGFSEYGVKRNARGVEKVFLKDFSRIHGDILLDYPVIDARSATKWLLAIYPEYHTGLFPDSILKTENSNVIRDISHTNSIHKVYITRMHRINRFCPGDIIVIYRTAEPGRRAEYSSVATSLCVVQEMRKGSSFSTERDFVRYSNKHSIFTEDQLAGFYNERRKGLYAVKMTYNLALPKRPTRHRLIEEVGLPRNGPRWDLMKLSDTNFIDIITLGAVDEGVVIY